MNVDIKNLIATLFFLVLRTPAAFVSLVSRLLFYSGDCQDGLCLCLIALKAGNILRSVARAIIDQTSFVSHFSGCLSSTADVQCS